MTLISLKYQLRLSEYYHIMRSIFFFFLMDKNAIFKLDFMT